MVHCTFDARPAETNGADWAWCHTAGLPGAWAWLANVELWVAGRRERLGSRAQTSGAAVSHSGPAAALCAPAIRGPAAYGLFQDAFKKIHSLTKSFREGLHFSVLVTYQRFWIQNFKRVRDDKSLLSRACCNKNPESRNLPCVDRSVCSFFRFASSGSDLWLFTIQMERYLLRCGCEAI